MCFLSKVTWQSSSHSCPTDNKEALWRFSKTAADVALEESVGMGKLPDSKEVIVDRSGRMTVGPLLECRLVNPALSTSRI